jgi:hypothetical protein
MCSATSRPSHLAASHPDVAEVVRDIFYPGKRERQEIVRRGSFDDFKGRRKLGSTSIVESQKLGCSDELRTDEQPYGSVHVAVELLKPRLREGHYLLDFLRIFLSPPSV